MPSLGAEMESGRLLQRKVKVGDLRGSPGERKTAEDALDSKSNRPYDGNIKARNSTLLLE